jgi:hypothetical protein
MNIKRGLVRLWMLSSILWAGLFLGISAPIWFAQFQLNRAEIAGRPLNVAEQKNGSGACAATGQKCFDVTAPNGSRYVVRVANTETEASVANIVSLNPEKFREPAQDHGGGWGADPYFVDLTGRLMVTGVEAVDLSLAKLLTLIAVAVPPAILGVGYAIGWVVSGFRTS